MNTPSTQIKINKLNKKAAFIRYCSALFTSILILPAVMYSQCTTGCTQTATTNVMPGTNNFSSTFCISTLSTLTYNQNFDMNGGTTCVGPNVTFSSGGGNWNGNWTVNNYGAFSRNITLNSGQVFNNYGNFTGSVSLNGGTIVNYNGATFNPSSFNFNGGSFTNNTGGTATFSSSITVNSGSTFTNNGTLTTTGLTLNSSATATLAGTTTINGSVTNNGTLTIGGVMTVTGNYNQNSSGTTNSQTGTQCNTMVITGTIQGQGTYNGTNGLLLNKTLSSPACTACLINGTVTTPPSQPANQITAPTLVAAANNISGTVVNPGGSPAATNYIVLRRFGSAVTEQPANYSNYTVGSIIGSSVVVAINLIATLSFTDANVIAANGCGTYYYAVFPYNTTSSCGVYNRTINATNLGSITVTGTAGTVSTSKSVCSSNTSGALTLAGYTGSVVRWESSVSPFSSWTAIANTSNTYTSGALTQTTQYRAVVNAGTGCSDVNSTPATITVNAAPALPTGTNAGRCGNGTVLLTATPGAGETIDWYAAASGGAALATGSATYVTPSISSTTIYYTAARNSTTGCVSAARTAVTATVDAAPSVTLGLFTPVCSGTSSVTLTYSAPVNSPDEYSIDWSSAANAAGLADVSWTALSGGTIPVTGLPAAAGNYAASVFVRNSITGCQTDVSNGTVVTCSTTLENASVTMAAPASGIFTAINFASYGLPTGTCGSFAIGSCHANTSLTTVQAAALGRSSFTIAATNGVFGDPCVSINKRLYIEAVSTAQVLNIYAIPTVATVTNGGTCGSGSGSATVSATASAGATIDWYASETGGTALATGTNTFTTPVLTATTTYYAEARNTSAGCLSVARTAVDAVVYTIPSATAATDVTRCGNGTAILTATPGAGETIDWYATASGGTALATGSLTYTTPSLSANTIYYAEARNIAGGCLSLTRTPVNVTVYASPSVTLSNFSAICAGTTSVTLNYLAPVNSPDQYMINWSATANAAGLADVSWTNLSGGTITVPGLISTAGNYAANIFVRNSTTGCQTDVSNGTVTTCGTAVENGSLTLTAPSGGVFSAINFASYGLPNGSCGAFTIGSCHATTSLTVVQNAALGRNTFTLAATNGNFGDPCVGTGKRLYIEAVSVGQILTINAAPVIAASSGASSCTPGTLNLSATPSAGAVTYWYATATGGTALATATTTFTTPSLTSSAIYYAEARNTTTGCISATRTAVNANIYSTPTAPVSGGNSRCGTGTVILSTTPGAGETIDWYAASTGGTALLTGNASYTTPSISTTTDYYAAARNTTTGCVSATRATITATVNAIPASPAGAGNSRCGTGTVIINATPGSGETIDWYSAASGGTLLAAGTSSYTTPSISVTTNYYATARNTSSSCVSARTLVSATINTVPVAPAAGNNLRCGNGTVTITATPAANVTVDWYAAASGGTALATGTTSFTTPSLSATTIYYAEARHTIGGCLSTTRTAVTASVYAIPAAPAATDVTRCGNGTATLTATPGTGETIDWYAAASGGTALATATLTYTTPSLSANTTYYAEARNIAGGCLSATRTAVNVTVNASPSVTLSNFSAICSGTTSVTLTYSAPVNSPDQYMIDWSATANAAGLADVTWTSLSGGTITVPGLIVTAGNYTANIFVKNGSTGCQTDVSNGTVTTCGTANEGGSITLNAPGGGLFSAINFASYGLPNGSCGAFTIGSCHAATSLTAVQNAALGKNTFTIGANNGVFGDPCVTIGKRLYIEAVSVGQILTINAAPTVSSSTGATRCGTGTASLSATPSAGAAIDWYAASTGGTALLSGSNSFTTPSISATTIYYAEARNTTTGCLAAARTAVTATVTVPTICCFSPASAGTGTSVVITGTNFTGATAVSFGGTAATSFTVNSATQITAVVAGGTSGSVSVTTACGTATRAGFIYIPAPTISSFTPTSGYIGNTITITGTNFTGATSVRFGGTAAASFTVVSSTSITAVLNTGATGSVSVTTPGGTASLAGFTYILATTWTGNTSNAWLTAANWNNGVPGATSLVFIPAVATMPAISSNVSINSLTVNSSASVSINSGNSLSLTGTVTNNGTINGAGAVVLNGTSNQAISGTGTINNLTINNTAGATIASAAGNMLSVKGSLTPTAGTLTTNGNLTLVSDASGTARVAAGASAGNYISGQVTWQRYIPARRGWRMINYPFISTGAPTINESIQEGAGGTTNNPNPGYGTHVTGGTAANGFDQNPSGTSSLKEFVSGALAGVTNTNQPVTGSKAYFIFVRGSRANNLAQGTSAVTDNTTLRGKGTLKQGNQSVSLSASGWQLVGNPFPGAINLHAVATTNSALINRNFKFWDPRLGGSNNVGGYVTASYNGSTYDYAPAPVSSLTEFAQSGSVFFVDAKSAGTLAINEAHKTASGSDNVFRPSAAQAKLYINLMSVNANGTTPVVDGVMTGFDDNFSNNLDEYDATKLSIGGVESLSMLRAGNQLSIERRTIVNTDDTIYLNLGNMARRGYKLEFDFSNSDNPLLEAWLEDKETGIITPLNTNSSSTYDFTITSNYDANRFRVIFKNKVSVVLPVTFKAISATRQDNNVLVNWQVDNQLNVAGYEVERSTDGVHFEKVTIKAVQGGNNSTASYTWLDENCFDGVNFYRVKIIDIDGKYSFSPVAKILMTTGHPMKIYPNPVVNNTYQLQMPGQAAGNYKVSTYNNAGQLIASNIFYHDGNAASKTVKPVVQLLPGVYKVEVIDENGKQVVINILVQ